MKTGLMDLRKQLQEEGAKMLFGYRIGNISCPTRYFADVSSV